MITKKIVLLAFSLFIGVSMSAQILTPAKWSVSVSKKHPKQGEIVELIFTVKLDATWHLYSNKQSYDLGPLPTTFEFEANDSYMLLGDMQAIGVKKTHDEVFEVVVNYFEEKAEFRQKVKILSSKVTIMGSYEYQVCTTVDGKCILERDEFEFEMEPTK
ncbi:protein-disulfide reductase DsbD domain-containing protein [Gelidibacter sp. F63206]|uniref:protein-disulfide reductase DsbD domain-containing protein n=1 Tax=Gelidibacter sp. F63206 TaxID=2926425 RepID=UPI001FF2E5A2|nr:protein-disulfide reductase DsbD domain-containing protein [Gelidibacter sp. F63206]MCK0114816.1 hypothetical protein [Gelidibacter sp. F63206]